MISPLRVGLILVFALSGVACFGAIRAVSSVPNVDVRRGLVGLLFLSGLWAITELGRLLAVSPGMKELIYILGLVVGLPTVGAWLYFCSAYTGHSYHRRAVFRRSAIVLYVLIVLLKVTNPYHGLYFSSSFVSDPFPHLIIQLMPAHWIVAGLSYVLTGIGFYLLYEQFSQSEFNTDALTILVIITGLPAILDILSYTGNLLLVLNYEPVGVAVFGVGVLYIVDDQFVALPAFWRDEVVDAVNEPILVFDRDDNIREYNTAAIKHFPALEDAAGQPIETAFPSLAAELNDGSDLVEIDCENESQYYTVERQQLTIEATQFGRVVILSDVTIIEQQRRELQRQNEQFDDFAKAVTHELRNTLAIADGYLNVVSAEITDDSRSASFEDCRRVSDALRRMERITTDLSKLARYGQTLDNTQMCDFHEIVERGWEAKDVDDMFLSVETDGSVQGDDVRLVELFRNAFEFMYAINATIVSVSLDAGKIVIWSDGDAISPDEIERGLSYGEAVPSAETGMLLPNVQTIARSHGWNVTVETASGHVSGIRLYINIT